MPGESLLFFFLVAAIWLFQGAFRRDYLSPGVLYLSVIFGTLGIAFLKLDAAMTPFHDKTWLILVVSAIAFMVGTVIARLYFFHRGIALFQGLPSSDRVVEIFSRYSWKRHFLWTFLGVLLFLVACMAEVWIYGVPVLFRKDVLKIMSPNGLKIGYWIFVLGNYGLLLILLIPAMFKKLNPHRGLRILAVVSFPIILALGFACYPGRSPVFQTIVFTGFFLNALLIRLRIRHILLGTVLILGLFIAGISAKKQRDYIDLTNKHLWIIPYQYVANNYWNLDYALNPPTDLERQPTTYGHRMIGGMLFLDLWPDWIGMGQIYGIDGVFNENSHKVHGLNSVGYWWGLYRDFSVVGVILFPLLAGLWQGWFYNRIRSMPQPPYLFVYSYINIFIVMSFFTDFWTILTASICVLSLWLIGKTCEKPISVRARVSQ